MTREYTVTWQMIYEADTAEDAVRQAIGNLCDPEHTCNTGYRVDGDDGSSVFIDGSDIATDEL